jgi:NAD(P)-dependent dehydrogenase (short-subunit alcohol dehydrogenase family)
MRAAIVTGASGGIGGALVAAFAEAGYRVIALDAQPLPSGIAADAFVRADLDEYCHTASVRAHTNQSLLAAVGGDDLAVLVNNAAVQILGRSDELTTADWYTTLNVNLLAPFLLAQGLLPRLETARGSVVNIASIHASLTKPRFVCYATSKAALVGLTRSMAVDLGGRVRVNAICPAAIDTAMLREGFAEQPELLAQLGAAHPSGRIGTPDEVGDAAVYLASTKAAFLNGTVLAVDGGISGRLHDPC